MKTDAQADYETFMAAHLLDNFLAKPMQSATAEATLPATACRLRCQSEEHFGESRLQRSVQTHLELVSVQQTSLDILPHALIPFTGERVPQVDGCMPVPGPHDGGIPRIQVLDAVGQGLYIARAGDDYPAGHGCAHELVARDRHRADGLLERDQRRTLHKGHLHHPCGHAHIVNIICNNMPLQSQGLRPSR